MNLLRRAARALMLTKNIVIYKTKLMRKGIGPRNLGASPLKQKNRKKEYAQLSERFDGFNKDKDTLIIGRSNSPRGATFQNNLSKNMGVQAGKMKNRVKNSTMLKFDDGGYKYITQHSKK